MELSKYIKLVLENTQAEELTLELRLNEHCQVSDSGTNKIKLKLRKK